MKLNILSLLNGKYGITEQDFQSAELRPVTQVGAVVLFRHLRPGGVEGGADVGGQAGGGTQDVPLQGDGGVLSVRRR